MSALLHGQISRRANKHYVCDRCLHSCISQETLTKHEEKCSQHRAQRANYPPVGSKVQFEKIQHLHPVDFFFVADMETILQPISTVIPDPSESSTTKITSHLPCAAAYYLVSATDGRLVARPRVFEGDNHVQHFIEALQEDGRKVTKILDVNVPHGVSDDARLEMLAEATECHICKGPRSETDPFVLVSCVLYLLSVVVKINTL